MPTKTIKDKVFKSGCGKILLKSIIFSLEEEQQYLKDDIKFIQFMKAQFHIL